MIDNSDVCFQVDSLVETTKKNRVMKLLNAVSELKDLTKTNGGSDDKQRFTRETQNSNSGNNNGRKKKSEKRRKRETRH